MVLLKILVGLAVLLFLASPSFATTYYVGKSGSDANSCATAQSSTAGDRKLTVAAGIGCLAAADTLIIGDGTYTESVGYLNSANPPSGTSDTVRTILKAENNRLVILNGCSSRVMNWSDRSFIEVDGIVLDGLDTCNSVLHFKDQVANGIETSYIRFKNGTVRNASGTTGGTGLIYGGNTTGFDNVHHIEIINNIVTGMDKAGIGGGNHCMYFKVPDSLIERNNISDCYGSGFTAHNTQGPIPSNTIIRYNVIHDTATGACIRVATGWNVSVYNNVCYDIRDETGNGSSSTPLFISNFGTSDNVSLYNNTVYGATNTSNSCILVGSGNTNAKVKNNICYNGANDIILNQGTASTVSNNRCASGCTTAADPLFVNAASNNFALQSTSTMIDAGTSTGLPCNGTCDIGAHETFTFASCVVEDGDASKIRVTFNNNAAPPLLPSTGITGFTARKAGVNDVITAAVRTGDSRVDLTLTDAIVNGNAVDISLVPASSNLTDSRLLGNTANQTIVQTLTNQSCTNNVGAAASHVFTQAAFEFHYVRGTEAAPLALPYASAPENVNIFVRPGGSLRLRVALTCTTADCPPTGFFPRYSKNAGGYSNVVPDVYGADNIAFCGTSPDADIPANGMASTDQLSTSGTFAAGALVRTSSAIPTVDVALNGKTELEYCFSLDTDTTTSDTYDIRVYQQDGTALNAYTVTPRITIIGSAGASGF